MKTVLSILLFLVTCIYILPVKETIKGNVLISLADMDDTKEENSKKEKQKELFSITITVRLINKITVGGYSHIHSPVPASLHIVETPPPDYI